MNYVLGAYRIGTSLPAFLPGFRGFYFYSLSHGEVN